MSHVSEDARGSPISRLIPKHCRAKSTASERNWAKPSTGLPPENILTRTGPTGWHGQTKGYGSHVKRTQLEQFRRPEAGAPWNLTHFARLVMTALRLRAVASHCESGDGLAEAKVEDIKTWLSAPRTRRREMAAKIRGATSAHYAYAGPLRTVGRSMSI